MTRAQAGTSASRPPYGYTAWPLSPQACVVTGTVERQGA